MAIRVVCMRVGKEGVRPERLSGVAIENLGVTGAGEADWLLGGPWGMWWVVENTGRDQQMRSTGPDNLWVEVGRVVGGRVAGVCWIDVVRAL